MVNLLRTDRRFRLEVLVIVTCTIITIMGGLLALNGINRAHITAARIEANQHRILEALERSDRVRGIEPIRPDVRKR